VEVYAGPRGLGDYILCGSMLTLKKPIQESVVVGATRRNT
jgi:hypothetical protein